MNNELRPGKKHKQTLPSALFTALKEAPGMVQGALKL